MKALLANHGEKLFFVLVAGLAGWSLYASLTSLGATEHLPASDIAAIEKIDKELRTKKAPPKTAAPYGEMLQANLDGHGIYAAAVGTIESPAFYEPPFMGTPPTVGTEVVGKIAPPTGLSATPDRAKVTFSWTASATAHMEVMRYDVHRCEESGTWSAEAVYAGPATSFIDKKVKPETEYAYKVRAVGVPDASGDEVIIKPAAPPLVRQGEVWITAFVGEAGDAKAMTPSNVDFECNNVFNRFGEDYANIVIKRWSSEKDDWHRFKTEPGIKVGDKVVGTRRYGIAGQEVETFDSGYILKKTVDEVRTVKKTVKKYVVDPVTGKVVKRDVEIETPESVQEIVLEKPDGSRSLIVPVGKGKATIRKKKPKDGAAAKPKDAAGGIADMRKLFEKSTSSSEGEERPGRAGRPAAPAAPATVRLDDARTSIKLTFPAGWAATGDMATDLGVGAAAATLLSDGTVTAYKGTAAKSGVVVADRPLNESEKKALLGRADGKVDGEREVLLLAAGLLRMDKEILDGIEVRGKARTRSTEAGKVISTYVLIVTEGQSKTAIKRYCATSPGHLYVLSFVCGEQDLATLEKSFNGIVYGWTW